MDSKDLRIGNIILSPDTGLYVIVELGHLNAITKSEGFNGKKYEPIQLTEDWLEKFGFSRMENSQDGQSVMYLKDSVFGWFFPNENSFEYNLGKKKTKYNYVHQLQNLYHSLTLEELKINSEKTANIE